MICWSSIVTVSGPLGNTELELLISAGELADISLLGRLPENVRGGTLGRTDSGAKGGGCIYQSLRHEQRQRESIFWSARALLSPNCRTEGGSHKNQPAWSRYSTSIGFGKGYKGRSESAYKGRQLQIKCRENRGELPPLRRCSCSSRQNRETH